MNKQLGMIALVAATLALTACAKKESADVNETEASAPVAETTMTAEQQAAIDAIDEPILDENNTDVPAEVANAPADAATPETTDAESSAAVSP